MTAPRILWQSKSMLFQEQESRVGRSHCYYCWYSGVAYKLPRSPCVWKWLNTSQHRWDFFSVWSFQPRLLGKLLHFRWCWATWLCQCLGSFRPSKSKQLPIQLLRFLIWNTSGIGTNKKRFWSISFSTVLYEMNIHSFLMNFYHTYLSNLFISTNKNQKQILIERQKIFI